MLAEFKCNEFKDWYVKRNVFVVLVNALRSKFDSIYR